MSPLVRPRRRLRASSLRRYPSVSTPRAARRRGSPASTLECAAQHARGRHRADARRACDVLERRGPGRRRRPRAVLGAVSSGCLGLAVVPGHVVTCVVPCLQCGPWRGSGARSTDAIAAPSRAASAPSGACRTGPRQAGSPAASPRRQGRLDEVPAAGDRPPDGEHRRVEPREPRPEAPPERVEGVVEDRAGRRVAGRGGHRQVVDVRARSRQRGMTGRRPQDRAPRDPLLERHAVDHDLPGAPGRRDPRPVLDDASRRSRNVEPMPVPMVIATGRSSPRATPGGPLAERERVGVVDEHDLADGRGEAVTAASRPRRRRCRASNLATPANRPIPVGVVERAGHRDAEAWGHRPSRSSASAAHPTIAPRIASAEPGRIQRPAASASRPRPAPRARSTTAPRRRGSRPTSSAATRSARVRRQPPWVAPRYRTWALTTITGSSAVGTHPVRRRRRPGSRSSPRTPGRATSPRSVSTTTPAPATTLRMWNRPAVSSGAVAPRVEGQPADLEEHLGQRGQLLLDPAVAVAQRAARAGSGRRRPRVPTWSRWRFANACSTWTGRRPPRVVAPEPVVEPEAVQVRRRAHLEHDVALAAAVGRAAGHREQLVERRRVALDELEDVELAAVVHRVVGLLAGSPRGRRPRGARGRPATPGC